MLYVICVLTIQSYVRTQEWIKAPGFNFKGRTHRIRPYHSRVHRQAFTSQTIDQGQETTTAERSA